MTFKAELIQGGKTATGIIVPPEIVEALGAGKRPAVSATINGYTYRSSVAVMGGDFMLGVSAEVRAGAGVKAGDMLEVTLELDTAPRVVDVPDDLTQALKADPQAEQFFNKLSYSNRLRHVLAINQAKTAETRQRRIEKSVGMFHEGKS
jgi:hypothetical protein